MSAEAFIAAARGSVGTRFQHGGRLPGVGLDCIGVIVCAAQAAGYATQDRKAYPLRPNGELQPELDRQMVRVTERAPGDVLLMRFEGDPHHLAIYTGETLIHAYAQAKKCVEQPFSQWWAARTVAAYRFPEIAT